MKSRKHSYNKDKHEDFNIPPVELTEEEQAALRKALQEFRREIDARLDGGDVEVFVIGWERSLVFLFHEVGINC